MLGEWSWANGYSLKMSSSNTVEIKRDGVSLGHFPTKVTTVFNDAVTCNMPPYQAYLEMHLEVMVNDAPHRFITKKQFIGLTHSQEEYEVSWDGNTFNYRL